MFERLRSWISGSSRDRSPASTGVPTDARAQAYARVKDAERRNDTRDLGRALMELQVATHAQLADEVWK